MTDWTSMADITDGEIRAFYIGLFWGSFLIGSAAVFDARAAVSVLLVLWMAIALGSRGSWSPGGNEKD